MTTNLFGDELSKHIKEIGEAKKIARKTMYRANAMPKRSYDYKSNPGNNRFQQRGGRRRLAQSKRTLLRPEVSRTTACPNRQGLQGCKGQNITFID